MQYRNERVADLRHLLRMTQGELAASIDINSSYISKIEHNTRTLTQDVVTQLSLRHQIPTTFFSAEDPIPNFAAPTFRKKASTPLRESRFVEVLQKLAMRLFHTASLSSGYTTWTDPVPPGISDPETAAALARDFFGIGRADPVRNVIRLLERNGAGVISDLSHGVDLGNNYHGVTRPDPNDNRPVVALFDSGRGDVNRLTAAHELGHLIFDHQSDAVPAKLKEDRAFQFGGAFLLPAEVARDWITPDLPLSGYLAIKAQYGISVPAAVRRGKELGCIDADRYRSLMIQISTRGWRSLEPGHVEAEQPALLGQAIAQAWPETPVRSAVNVTGVPENVLRHWASIPDRAPIIPDRQEQRAVIDLDFARRARTA